ncbi:MAG: methylamine utilization protein [Candidatus Eisenbacteria bacterium]|uniref:Methylamine utilization protein n=1 Tax=Eiseniibacteriota bacterium TaxID=2212470 RepID=A0A538U558_UNCEI|nr:MAG: methylamine utilization protein [Candidatus Eisenbacteria bacterium]
MRIRSILAIATLLASVAPAGAGTIRGRLHLGSGSKPVTIGASSMEVMGLEQAVVWVDSLPPKFARRHRGKPRPARIVQIDRQFAPRVTTVIAGTTIRFVNRDKVFHNVFSISPARRFDIGRYSPSAIRDVTFDHPGVVNLFCEIHPWMSAYVIVLPNRFYARPDRAGVFQLPKLPPGRYRLHFWHPTHGEQRREVEVPSRGDGVVAVSL